MTNLFLRGILPASFGKVTICNLFRDTAHSPVREAAAAHAAKKGVSNAEVFERDVHSPAMQKSDVFRALCRGDAAEQFARAAG